ncbi:hypothetical protein Y032_0011g1407 [Ancylostoma ceylanicum]|uniref:Uncharacterized protein n=1 Tax=Ancylostoma ceylanicum TaxID=53326 RepID=A0A016VEH5_9BILA|nr:hypothetical protein Y032_0011g1407 [Ancylostoma ceylanicum]
MADTKMATLGSVSTALSPQIGRSSLCSSYHCDCLAVDHTENDSTRRLSSVDSKPLYPHINHHNADTGGVPLKGFIEVLIITSFQ